MSPKTLEAHTNEYSEMKVIQSKRKINSTPNQEEEEEEAKEEKDSNQAHTC